MHYFHVHYVMYGHNILKGKCNVLAKFILAKTCDGCKMISFSNGFDCCWWCLQFKALELVQVWHSLIKNRFNLKATLALCTCTVRIGQVRTKISNSIAFLKLHLGGTQWAHTLHAQPQSSCLQLIKPSQTYTRKVNYVHLLQQKQRILRHLNNQQIYYAISFHEPKSTLYLIKWISSTKAYAFVILEGAIRFCIKCKNISPSS